MHRPGVRRSLDDRWVGGVCAGVADRLGVDPVLVRVATIALALLGGVGVVAYALAWLLLPDSAGRIEAQRMVAGDVSGSAVAALALLAVALLVPEPWAWLRDDPLLDGGDLLGVVVIGAVIAAAVVWWPRQRTEQVQRSPAAAPGTTPLVVKPVRRGPGAVVTTAVLGVALLAAGAAWLAGVADVVPGSTTTLATCAALAVVAVALIALGVAGRRDGALGFIGVVLAVLALASPVVPSWSTTRLAGDAVWQPVSLERAERGWSLGAGSALLDLTDLEALDATGGAVEVPVRVGMGELRIEVPQDADVTVRGRALIGEVEHQRDGATVSSTESGIASDRVVSTGDGVPDLVVDARTLIGNVTVVEVAR